MATKNLIKISSVISTIISIIIIPISLNYLRSDRDFCIKYIQYSCLTNKDLIFGVFLHFIFSFIISFIFVFLISFLINKTEDSVLTKIKKLSIYMIGGASFLFIIWLITTILDYRFCPPQIMDVVFTCHDELLLWPTGLIILGFIVLSILGVPLFIITKIILRIKSKKVNHKR